MMRRPADQCKLLFLYFLRYTSAAFASSRASISTAATAATTPSEFFHRTFSSKASTVTSVAKTSSTSLPSMLNSSSRSSSSSSSNNNMNSNTISNPSHFPLLQEGGHIALRVARRDDIPGIQQCNLATLPENYHSNFYAHQLRTWPDLALVMEHVPASYVTGEEEDVERSSTGSGANRVVSNVGSFFGGGYDPMSVRKCRIVGYVLGRVDQHPTTSTIESPSSQRMDEGFSMIKEDHSITVLHGHVTSLAVLYPYRRRGLALHLMNQLHFQLREMHHVDEVDLHVRVSNDAAKRLYEQELGYAIHDVIPGYYQDGEDAYLMRKDLLKEPSTIATTPANRLWQHNMKINRPFTEFRKKLLNNYPFHLPRIVWDRNNEREQAQALFLSKTSSIPTGINQADGLSRQDGTEERLPELINKISMSQ